MGFEHGGVADCVALWRSRPRGPTRRRQPPKREQNTDRTGRREQQPRDTPTRDKSGDPQITRDTAIIHRHISINLTFC